jgi:hypothetical protein
MNKKTLKRTQAIIKRLNQLPQEIQEIIYDDVCTSYENRLKVFELPKNKFQRVSLVA